MPDDAPAPCPPTPSSGDLLARRLGETAALSPLWQRARLLGLGRPRDLLAVAVDRGARHYGGRARAPEASLAASRVLRDDELIVLLLHGRNPFEPLLIRAAAELLRRRPLDPHLLAKAARRERCERPLPTSPPPASSMIRREVSSGEPCRPRSGGNVQSRPGSSPTGPALSPCSASTGSRAHGVTAGSAHPHEQPGPHSQHARPPSRAADAHHPLRPGGAGVGLPLSPFRSGRVVGCRRTPLRLRGGKGARYPLTQGLLLRDAAQGT
jgi:hypothetical protein